MPKLLIALSLTLLAPLAQASETVQFSSRELAAVLTLVRPELNSVVLNGTTGVFTPAPALRAMGLERKEFEITMDGLGGLANPKFNNLRTGVPQIRFTADSLELELPFVDNTRAVQMGLLGALGLKGASVVTTLRWSMNRLGQQMLMPVQTVFRGAVTGTGLAGTPMATEAVKTQVVKMVQDSMTSALEKPEMQTNLQTALLGWAKFQTGETQASILPGTLRFYLEAGQTGLAYETER